MRKNFNRQTKTASVGHRNMKMVADQISSFDLNTDKNALVDSIIGGKNALVDSIIGGTT
jgi:hypothetical protein